MKYIFIHLLVLGLCRVNHLIWTLIVSDECKRIGPQIQYREMGRYREYREHRECREYREVGQYREMDRVKSSALSCLIRSGFSRCGRFEKYLQIWAPAIIACW